MRPPPPAATPRRALWAGRPCSSPRTCWPRAWSRPSPAAPAASGARPTTRSTSGCGLATVLSVAGLPWATVRQVHGAGVVQAHADLLGQGPPEARPPLAEADGIVTRQPGLVLAVFTADCVPVLLADPAAGVVGAVHAGWRGLAAGVVEAGVAAFAGLGADLGASVALVGPAIGPCCYEVGPEVAEAVGERYSAAAATTLKGSLAIDTTAAAVQALERAGVGAVRAAQQCTAHQPERFFSYRRDGTTGRQAGLVAILERGPA